MRGIDIIDCAFLLPTTDMGWSGWCCGPFVVDEALCSVVASFVG